MMDELLGERNSMVECVAYADGLPNPWSEFEQRDAAYMPFINAWSLKVNVAVLTEKTVAVLLKGNLRRF